MLECSGNLVNYEAALEKIVAGLAAVGAIGAVLLLRPNNGPQRAVEETRRALRQHIAHISGEFGEIDMAVGIDERHVYSSIS